MAERRADRKWKLRFGAFFGLSAGASLLGACAFWSLGDLDAHANDGPDAAVDAPPDAVTDALTDAGAADVDAGAHFGGTSFCSDAGASTLFCDDFDSDAATWTTSFTCIACSQIVATPDGGDAPSPPNVLFVDAPAGEASPSSFRTETFLGKYGSITSDFWGYVDESDSNGQPTFQEMAYEIDDKNFIRLRPYVQGTKFGLGTSITSTAIAQPSFDNGVTVSLVFKTWHHVRYTVAAVGSAFHYSWSYDGTPIVVDQVIPNSDKITGEVSRIDLRSGVFYVGPQPTNGDTKFRMDNVLVSSP
ncbi:MAG TPA: hypothetical protein VF407_13945 [Polyangiaceae bacterium]